MSTVCNRCMNVYEPILKRLRDALAFYADRTLYTGRRGHHENYATDLQWDSGYTARRALGDDTPRETE